MFCILGKASELEYLVCTLKEFTIQLGKEKLRDKGELTSVVQTNSEEIGTNVSKSCQRSSLRGR